MGTEMGSTVTTRGQFVRDSIIGYPPDQDISFPWWARYGRSLVETGGAERVLAGRFCMDRPRLPGEATPFTWPNHQFRISALWICGFPKNIYYYYQSWWTDKDVLHISPHWNWPGKQGQPVDVWVKQ